MNRDGTTVLSALARISTRYRWIVVALWLMLLLGAVLGSRAFGGTFSNDLTLADAERYRIGVKMWQGRMAQRGWDVEVDGFYGQQSAAVAKRFAHQKDIKVAVPGTVDKTVWDAAWTLAVS